MNIKRMPPTHINDYRDVPKPKLTSKYKPSKKTLKDEIAYQIVDRAETIETIGTVCMTYANKYEGWLKYVLYGLGYGIKYAGKLLDKKIMRAEDMDK